MVGRLVTRQMLHGGLDSERHEREKCKQGGAGEGRAELVFVVKDLDMERQRICLSTNVPRHNGNRAEFPHRTCIAEQYPIEEAPLDVRKGHP